MCIYNQNTKMNYAEITVYLSFATHNVIFKHSFFYVFLYFTREYITYFIL